MARHAAVCPVAEAITNLFHSEPCRDKNLTSRTSLGLVLTMSFMPTQMDRRAVEVLACRLAEALLRRTTEALLKVQTHPVVPTDPACMQLPMFCALHAVLPDACTASMQGARHLWPELFPMVQAATEQLEDAGGAESARRLMAKFPQVGFSLRGCWDTAVHAEHAANFTLTAPIGAVHASAVAQSAW